MYYVSIRTFADIKVNISVMLHYGVHTSGVVITRLQVVQRGVIHGLPLTIYLAR